MVLIYYRRFRQHESTGKIFYPRKVNVLINRRETLLRIVCSKTGTRFYVVDQERYCLGLIQRQ